MKPGNRAEATHRIDDKHITASYAEEVQWEVQECESVASKGDCLRRNPDILQDDMRNSYINLWKSATEAYVGERSAKAKAVEFLRRKLALNS